MSNKCAVCNKRIDEYGVCDLACPRVVHEDDQLQAEVAEAMQQPEDEVSRRLYEVGMEAAREALAYQRFKRDLGPRPPK